MGTIVESLSDYAIALRFEDLPSDVVHQAKGMPYTAAVALRYGAVEAKHFGADYWRDPRLLELVQKVKVSVSEDANRRAPEAMLSVVEVVTTSGARFSAAVPYHRGHWKNPMTDQEVEAKFRALAAELLVPAQTDALLERVWNLDRVKDIGEVIKMVKQPRAATTGSRRVRLE